MVWTDFNTIITGLTDIIGSIIPLLITLATVYFLWGVLGYIMAAGDEKKITEARHFIAYGLIGLFVIVSVWGLVSVITNTFIGSDNSGMPSGPTI